VSGRPQSGRGAPAAEEGGGAGRGPLDGIRVVELAGLGPAQLGAGLVSDLGAAVVRLDRPADVPGEAPASVPTDVLSRGRRSVAIDLKSPAGHELATRLIEGADVLIDPYRPGVTERLGLGPEPLCARNDRLVYARMTAWGQDGPLARTAAHDINVIALAGALHPLGELDAVPPVPLNLIADFGGGGMLLAFGIAAALFERERSGRGQVLDVAMLDGVGALLTHLLQLRAGGSFTGERHAHWLQGAAPWYRAYRTADGRFVSVGALEPKFYAELLLGLGLEPDDWPQWDRAAWAPLSMRMEQIFASRPLGAWLAELADRDACIAPALELDELLEHPHLAARGTYVRYAGTVQPAPAPRFGRTPGAIAGAPPWPGQHTREVLGELGIAPDRVEELLRAGVVAHI
jgi:alpha-methylacyl-CoA racemase